MSFSIYDILKEADGDEESTPDAAETNTEEPAGDEAPADDAGNENNTEDTGGDDDFDIDTSLDDVGGGGDDTADDNDTGGDDIENTSSGSDEEDEPVEANTDIFSSLSAEEQQMKIRELKNQYADLYNSCEDFIEKLGTIEINDITLGAVSRITNIILDLKDYISDYLYYQFASKSYYENDVMLNRFFAVFKTVSTILDNISNYNSENR